jgi:ABC-type nitrate/sulfonate/bicarbonate transport system ATPase subunit
LSLTDACPPNAPQYTAELKRSRKEPLASKKQAVDELIQKLALDSCRHVHIGDALAKGISGGQAKRVNIGIALVCNPRCVMFQGFAFLPECRRLLQLHSAQGCARTASCIVLASWPPPEAAALHK